ncbi:MAG: zinc ribbon domain-containing protein [Clostridia bacterium]|nr:zinc ribbon domain-containing protein [Clostridia bacterium]
MKQFNEKHNNVKMILKIVGPITLVVGLFLFGSVFFSFFNMSDPFNNNIFSKMPNAFIGIILSAIGSAMTNFAYMGTVAKYTADEMTPIASHVIKNIKTSLDEKDSNECPKCHIQNDLDASFCDHCGYPLKKLICSCGTQNESDAKYCKKCGEAL